MKLTAVLFVLLVLTGPVLADEKQPFDNAKVVHKVALLLSNEGEPVVSFLLDTLRIVDYTNGTEDTEVSVTEFVNAIRKYSRTHKLTVSHQSDNDNWFVFIKAGKDVYATKAYILKVDV